MASFRARRVASRGRALYRQVALARRDRPACIARPRPCTRAIPAPPCMGMGRPDAIRNVAKGLDPCAMRDGVVGRRIPPTASTVCSQSRPALAGLVRLARFRRARACKRATTTGRLRGTVVRAGRSPDLDSTVAPRLPCVPTCRGEVEAFACVLPARLGMRREHDGHAIVRRSQTPATGAPTSGARAFGLRRRAGSSTKRQLSIAIASKGKGSTSAISAVVVTSLLRTKYKISGMWKM